MDSRYNDSVQLTTVNGEGDLFRLVTENDRISALCRYRDREVLFSIRYDFKEQPLQLKGGAELNDEIRILVLPHRIELLVRGKLADEEWPCGRHSILEARCAEGGTCLIEPYAEPDPAAEPCITGTFVQSEGWNPEENVFVGDGMPYTDEGRYHVLYLKDRHHHRSKWGLGAHQWSHISTEDFITWQVHPMSVAIDAPEEASICTGSWIKHDNRHYLYYTIRTCDGSPAKIRRSVSADGYHFQKDHDFAVLLSERYTGAYARDPKIIMDDQGTYHLLLTTSLREEKRGCLAHLTSRDLEHWEEENEPFYISPTEDEPECCDYFFKDGWYSA